MSRSRVQPVPAPASRRRGFTLVELLVAVAVVAVLLGLIIVGMGGALTQGKRAKAQQQILTLNQGVESFYNDIGYHPPLITRIDTGSETAGIVIPEMFLPDRQAYRDELERVRYHSEYSLGAYLLGLGDLNNDRSAGYKDAEDDGAPGEGLKHPGDSKAWKRFGQGGYEHSPTALGRTYGPYVDVGSQSDFVQEVRVSRDLSRVYTPDEPEYDDNPDFTIMYRFVDPWGNAIRYYRDYPTRDPDTNLPDATMLPIELRDAQNMLEIFSACRGSAGWPTPSAYDASRERPVLSADYVLLAAADQPVEYKDPSLAPLQRLAPFGDAYVNDASERSDFPVGSSPCDVFDFGDVNSAAQAEQVLRFLQSNVRYPQ